MSAKQALLRPIEITTSNQTLVLNMSVTGNRTYTITAGVHPNFLSFLEDYASKILASNAVTVNIASDNHVFLSHATQTLTPTHSEAWRILGFSGAESAGTIVAADYTPLYSWFPTYHSGDTERFVKPSASQFYGSSGIDGNLSGISVEARAQRAIMWPAEAASNTFTEANATSYADAVAGLTRVESDRCFWTQVNAARTVSITAASSGNISPKGVYYVPAWSDYVGNADISSWPDSADWDSGGTYFVDASNADEFVFCSAPDPMKTPNIFRDIHITHYDCSVMLRTADAPSFTTGGSAIS